MKSFIGIRHNYIELSLWDMVKMMCGRELKPMLPGELIIRHAGAHAAFNLTSRLDGESAGPTSIKIDRPAQR